MLNPIDVINKPLELGDYVLVMVKDYRNFTLARVMGFTPSKVRVVYKSNGTNQLYPKHYLTDQVVKITEFEALSREEKENVDTLYIQEMKKKELETA